MELGISNTLKIKANKIVSERTCVIGQSGSGKSYTVAVMCEELAENNIGFCIVDLEGEYFSLKEKYPILWIGTDPNADVDIGNVNMKKLAKKLVSNRFPAIFDVSEVDDPKETVKRFIKELYKIETKLKQPYLLIVEEIDKFAPQRGEVLYEIEEVSRRGRKRGLGLMIATQRPALVNKNVLSQCGNQIIGKLTITNDIDSVKIFFLDKEKLETLPRLKPGQFFVMGNIGKGDAVQIRERVTTHKASTPMLVQKKAIKIEDLKSIEAEIENPKKEIEEEEVEGVKKEIVPPKLEKEEAFEKIKNKTKRFGFFGGKAQLSGFHLALHPVYLCNIKYLKKTLAGSKFIDENAYFDAVNGDVLDLSKGFKVKFDASEFLGLSSLDLNIFNEISKSKGISTSELSMKCQCSEQSVRSSIKKLTEKHLVSHKRAGRNILYVPFTKKRLPRINRISEKEIKTEKKKITAKLEKEEVTINELKGFVRGLHDEAGIVGNKIIYYPFYAATAIRGKKSWKIRMDAVTGKFLN